MDSKLYPPRMAELEKGYKDSRAAEAKMVPIHRTVFHRWLHRFDHLQFV